MFLTGARTSIVRSHLEFRRVYLPKRRAQVIVNALNLLDQQIVPLHRRTVRKSLYRNNSRNRQRVSLTYRLRSLDLTLDHHIRLSPTMNLYRQLIFDHVIALGQAQ